MTNSLQNTKVAILFTDGVEQTELTEPKALLEKAGAKTFIVSPNQSQVKAWDQQNWGETFTVDIPLEKAKPQEFDALLLPGGVINPDRLRINPHAVEFVKTFMEHQKPIGAICHGPWTLVQADVLRGKKLTSWPSLQVDIQNAGGQWMDCEVVVDHNLVTSRMPADIPAFTEKFITLLGKLQPV